VFKITQHSRDKELLKGLIKFFNCGRIEKRKTKAYDFTITSLKDLNDKFIPIIIKYPIIVYKDICFKQFCKAIYLMKIKSHLTKQGLLKLIKIKCNMKTQND